MATIKSYTDLAQSKTLSKILPIESADMFYTTNSNYKGKIIGLLDVPLYIGSDGFVDTEMGEIYAWSLAALLSVLPFHLIVNNQRYAFSMHKGLNETYMFRYNVFNTDICLYSTDYYNNPVDACYEMILKLHELNLL